MAGYTLIRKRRGQIWSLDMMMAVVMFMLALFMVYQYLINSERTNVSDIEELARDSQVISSQLLSEGLPKGWNSTDVKMIGVAKDFRINETCWERFSNISYDRSRSVFNTRYHYYVYFTDNEDNLITIGGIDGIGKPGVVSANVSEVQTKRIIKVDRLAIYDSKIIKMVLFLWE